MSSNTTISSNYEISRKVGSRIRCSSLAFPGLLSGRKLRSSDRHFWSSPHRVQKSKAFRHEEAEDRRGSERLYQNSRNERRIALENADGNQTTFCDAVERQFMLGC